MENRIPNNKVSCRVLAFNPLKRLIAIFQSVTATAKAFGVTGPNVNSACKGKSVSCCGMYFRQLDPTVEVTFDDLGTLSLEEYDKLCGVERKYYKTKEMSRKGMKYKTKSTK